MRSESRTRRDLRAIWIDGMAWSVMVGMGEQSIPACALAVGASSVAAGLSTTVPMVVGATLQLVLAPVVSRVRSLQRWVVLTCGLQALVFVPLAAGAWRGTLSEGVLYASATLYWTLGLAGNPAWVTWVEQHVPRALTHRFWARRQAWIHVFTMLGLLAAGFLLRRGSSDDAPLVAFALVFLGALLARLVSAWFLARQSELELHPPAARRVAPLELLARFRRGHDGRLLVALLASQAALSFALPYFFPWLLGPRGFGYAEAMALLAAAVLGRFLALPAWGAFARRRSLAALFLVSGALSVPVTLGWIVADGFVGLLAAQLFAGVALGGFELATFLAFFARIERNERTSVMTLFHLANALAFALGSLAGGALLAAQGGLADTASSAFVVVFAVAAGLRLLAYLLVVRAER